MVFVGLAEDEDGALVGVGHELLNAVAEPDERVVAPRRSYDEQREAELQPDAPQHRPPVHLQPNYVITQCALSVSTFRVLARRRCRCC